MGLIIVLWFLGFVVLPLIWLMTRSKGRLCPACGTEAKKGVTRCSNCAFDFAAAAHGQPGLVPPPTPAD